MIYNIKKMDDDIFRTTITNIGRDTIDYYTNKTEKVLVEPNGSFDGGKIYCRSDSWVDRGDILKISNNWYVVSQMSNLASDVYNIGVITRCDVTLLMRLGSFAYYVPAVASKYNGNSNVRGIIDDSIEGKLSFITGYTKEFDELVDNPCVTVFGKVWQIGNYLNVNKVMTVYCQGAPSSTVPEFCIEPIPLNYKVGDKVDLKIHLLNTADGTLPDDMEIVFARSGDGTVEGTTATFTNTGTTTLMIRSKKNIKHYVTPVITVT